MFWFREAQFKINLNLISKNTFALLFVKFSKYVNEPSNQFLVYFHWACIHVSNLIISHKTYPKHTANLKILKNFIIILNLLFTTWNHAKKIFNFGLNYANASKIILIPLLSIKFWDFLFYQ